MQIIINSQGEKLSDREKNLVLKKLADVSKILEKFSPENITADIRVKRSTRWGYKISFSTFLPKKKHIFVQVKGKEYKSAVNKLKDIVVRRVRQYKEKVSENKAEKEKLRIK